MAELDLTCKRVVDCGMTSNEQLTVATEILRQLGGSRFIAMTGAKNIMGGERELSLKLGKGAKDGITHLTVTLSADDTYRVRFCRVHGAKVTEKGTTEGVYADMLRDVFTARTGFYTSL